ncbi:MAG: winged helix-turn-helix domain-containing protein [Terriglobia bacterium]|nr:winged helix-turn-helix domain-containing protein [Terriglobia bacterium]
MPRVTSPIRFGAFEVDLNSGEIRKNGTRIHLADQPLQVLALLLEHPGELVTREELRQHLWSTDTFVDFEHSLNAAVKRLREALNDSADNPRFIETVPRHGYRFIGPTVVEHEAAAEPRTVNHWKLISPISTVLLSLAVAAGLWLYRNHLKNAEHAQSHVHTLAVLPFVDMSPGRDQQYFSDGLSDELLTSLAKLPELRVSARTSSFQFKDKNEDPQVIGKKLNVGSIVEGGVRKDGTRVRITVQLINTTDGFNLWSESYDREMKDIFAVQEEIANSVAESLKVSLLAHGSQKVSARNQSVDAYNAFLQGRYFAERRDEADVRKAIEYYNKSLKLNPDYAPAWAGLAIAYMHLADPGYIPVEEGYGKARVASERALRLDANLGKAHQCMGFIKMVHDWDWVGAEASFERAKQLDPGDADTIWQIARLKASLGNLKEAGQIIAQAATIDPLNTTVYLNLGNIAYYAGNYEDAAVALRKALEVNPAFPVAHAYLGRVHLRQSRPRDAFAEFQLERDPGWRRFGLAIGYHATGQSKEADAALTDFITNNGATYAYQIAQVYAFRGDKDKAFEWLERAYSQRDGGLTEMKGDPLLRSLEHDPRYAPFMKKMNLPL